MAEAKARLRGAVLRSRSAKRRDRDQREGEIVISTVLRRSGPVQMAEGDRERERSAARSRRCVWGWAAASVSHSFSLSLSPFAHL